MFISLKNFRTCVFCRNVLTKFKNQVRISVRRNALSCGHKLSKLEFRLLVVGFQVSPNYWELMIL